ncbi:MAG TPA: hypothetical protein EYP07_15305, partial [Kiloniellaceae bacterium]|nr:hypothetical protein [Kiloniellaceae bacterium]
MTDDLTRGYEGQDDTTAESAENTPETTVITGSEGSAAVVGQAAAPVNVARPAPGQTVEIQAAAGQVYNLTFPPGGAQVAVQGENFILAFDDDGDGTPDSQIVFLGLVTVVEAGDAPTFTVAGTEVGADVLLSQALALAGQDDATLETAAGPGAVGTGATQYLDFLGDILDLLAAQGVIPPVLLEFGLIGVEPDEIELVLEDLDEIEVPLLINEIGVPVRLEVPDLPGSEEPETPGDGGEGGTTDPQVLSREYDGKDEPEEYNFIELINTDDAPFDPEGLTIEILNPDGEVISFTIPAGLTIPAGGFIVFYQLAEDDGFDGTEDLAIRVFDSQGNVVGGLDIEDAVFWDLGDDTTDEIAVNVVFENEEGVLESADTFAANITAEQLGALTDPDFAGAPPGFGSPLLDLNFDTFNGQFTGNHHIFSRVDLDDTDSQADWTTNNKPTDGALNDTKFSDLIAYSAGQDGGEGGLVKIDLETGETEFVGPIEYDGDLIDVEGLAFGKGEDECFLFGFEDEGDKRFVKIDPKTGEVVEVFEQEGFEAVFHSQGQVGDEDNQFVQIEGQLENAGDFVVVNGATPDGTNSIVWSGRSEDGDGYMRVYNDTGEEVTWYVTSTAGPDAGEFFEVTIPANSAVVINIGQGTDDPGFGINNVIRAFDAPPGEGGVAQTPTATIGDDKSIDTVCIEIDDPGLTVSADGKFYVIGDDEGVYEVVLNEGEGTYSLVLITTGTTEAESGFDLSSLAADPNDADVLYALGDDDEEEGGVVKLFKITISTGVVEELPGTIGGGDGDDYGLSFDAFGRLWALDEDAERAFQVDPTTGDEIPGTSVDLSTVGLPDGFAFESLAIQLFGTDPNPWDPLNDDLNPGQVNDDPLAGQNFIQATDTEGEVLEGRGGPDFLLGAEGDDSLYGGSQELVEEQAEKVLNQFEQLMEAGVPVFGGGDGAEGEHCDTGEEVDLNHKPLFSDHNDFLFGEAGDDEMYGGSGGDYMIGGEGDDSMDGGTGDDQIFGDGSDEIGGLPEEGEGSGEEGEVLHGNDVIAGDALNNLTRFLEADGSEGGEPVEQISLVKGGPSLDGFDEAAAAILGGNDTIGAGAGDDMASGDALATGGQSVYALGYADNSFKRPENGVREDDEALVQNSDGGEGGNILLVDGDGNVTAAVSEADIESATGFNNVGFNDNGIDVASDGTIYFTEQESDAVWQWTPGGGVELVASKAAIAAAAKGDPTESVDPEGLVVGSDGFLYITEDDTSSVLRVDPSNGTVTVLTTQAAMEALGGISTIDIDGGGLLLSADGLSLYVASDGTPDAIIEIDIASGTPTVLASGAPFSDLDVYMELAPNGDIIVADDSGAQTFYRVTPEGVVSGFLTTEELEAVFSGSINLEGGFWFDSDGNFYVTNQDTDEIARFPPLNPLTGKVDPSGAVIVDDSDLNFNGDAVLVEGAGDFPEDTGFANDVISGDDGNDSLAGDAAAIAVSSGGEGYYPGDDSLKVSFGEYTEAVAVGINEATYSKGYEYDGAEGPTGNDTIDGGQGADKIAGEALAIADGAEAFAFNTAKGYDIEAGNDVLSGDEGNDDIGGDAVAIADGSEGGARAEAETCNKAEYYGAVAGSDRVVAGEDSDRVAGDSLAIATGPGADAYGGVYNIADDAGTAGSDSIDGNSGNDDIGGDAAAFASGPFADAYGETHNTATGYDSNAGDDTIDAGTGSDRVAGGSMAVASGSNADADAETYNTASDDGSAGNDVIDGDGDGGEGFVAGNDSIAGDSAAFADDVNGFAEAHTYNTVGDGGEGISDDGTAGSDDIDAGDGENLVAGDSLAQADGAEAFTYNNAYGGGAVTGDDDITTGDDNDTVSGGSLAKSASDDALAYTSNMAGNSGSAGNDDIDLGEGNNRAAGDALAISASGNANAVADNTANGSGSEAGNDSIDAGDDSDTVSGGARAFSTDGSATATTNNNALNGGEAGNDDITADASASGDDVVAGDSQAESVNGHALSNANNTATVGGGEAGNDDISTGGFSVNGDLVAGDSMAKGATATAYGDNKAYGGGSAGDDNITSGEGNDTISGGALATATGAALADQHNIAEFGGSAGNDDILADEGTNGDYGDEVAGDAMARSVDGSATALSVNDAGLEGQGGRAGNDTIDG